MRTAVDRALLRAWPLPAVHAEADKEQRGRVLVVGGSVEMPGAIVLAGTAALRAGAGKLRLATAARAAVEVGVAFPEARVFSLTDDDAGFITSEAAAAVASAAATVDAVVIGVGMHSPDVALDLVVSASQGSTAPLVVDAAPLLGLRSRPDVAARLRGRAILTPNAQELRELIDGGGDVDDVVRVASDLGVVVSCKGPTTVTADAEGHVYEDEAGGRGLATSGSGDVVAGIAGGLVARGTPLVQAAVWASHLHALAGDRVAVRTGPVGFLARELVDELPRLLAELES